MWAFEAEALGASSVVAADIGDERYYDHFTFCREHLGSRVVGYYNIPVEDLSRRMDCFWKFNPGKFDIVQHLGLLYHLKDPLLSLDQCRACLNTGGFLLLESAACVVPGELPMALFNSKSDVYVDETTYWALNEPAILDALKMSGFEPLEFRSRVPHSDMIERLTLLAKAI
jgi:SAM-dependent methyltransferase